MWQIGHKLTHAQEEYHLFYQTFFKDFSNPLAWHHFSGDSGSGVAFKAIVFLPSRLYVLAWFVTHGLTLRLLFRDAKFWQTLPEQKPKDIKLMVKRVFITSDLGDDSLPKWASWVKVVVDGTYQRLTPWWLPNKQIPVSGRFAPQRFSWNPPIQPFSQAIEANDYQAYDTALHKNFGGRSWKVWENTRSLRFYYQARSCGRFKKSGEIGIFDAIFYKSTK